MVFAQIIRGLVFLFLTNCLITCQPTGYYKTVIVHTERKTFSLESEVTNSSILIGVTIRNNAYSLPTFLKTLENLECKNVKKKCDLWVIFDKCSDKSQEIFKYWLSNTRPLFDTIIMLNTQFDLVTKEKHPELDQLYFSQNLKLRAIKYAIDRQFSYIFFLSADSILINPNTIELLMRGHKDVVAPLLASPESFYSTFKTADLESFKSYYNQDKMGFFPVKSVRECFLLKLTASHIENLLEINGPEDFVLSQHFDNSNIKMFVCNSRIYGYITEKDSDLESHDENFNFLRREHLLKGPDGGFNEPLPVTKFLESTKKRRTMLGFNKIYVINLERRPDRKQRMESTLDDLNIAPTIVKAVDSKNLTEDYLKNLGLSIIPNYKDPFSDRTMNSGEIACFLSHYFLWKETVEKNYKKIIILEDDARFAKNFKSILVHFMNQMDAKNIDWDLIYLGRKIMNSKVESWNPEFNFKAGHGIINPSFSHWTVAYALSLNGAKKLMNSEPLKRVLPVDEYLPLMFDKQPNTEWTSYFPKREINAFAIKPSIVEPTHFTGQKGYVSDTEMTTILHTSEIETLKDNLADTNLENTENNFRVEL